MLGLLGFAAAAPAALAAAANTQSELLTPVSFWDRAVESFPAEPSTETLAAALPTGRMVSARHGAGPKHEAAPERTVRHGPEQKAAKRTKHAAPNRKKQDAPKQPANAAPRKRWITGSHFERTTAPRVLREQGCEAGRRHVNGLVILAFGKPAYNGHTYGAILFSNRFAGNHRITTALKAYSVGYAKCLPQDSTARITLARGTSDYDIEVPNAVHAGRRWSRETMTLAKYLREHPGIGDHVRSAAAIDAEPAWDRSFRRTHEFFEGYREARTGYLLYDFGSLDGGVGAIWNLRQAFYVSGGMKYARVVPEIYFPEMVHQWAELARKAMKRYGRPVQFVGVITQRAPGCGPHVCGMGPRQAHEALERALASASSTRDLAGTLATVTNIS